MKPTLLLMALALTAAQTTVHPDPDNFLLLDDASYPEIAADTDPKVLFFYSKNNCSNCDKIKSTLAGLIQDLSVHSIPVFLIDCDTASVTCKRRLNNRKPPAVLLQISTKFVFYYGDYSQKSMTEFIHRRLVEKRVTPFSSEVFKREAEKSKKDQHAILVYRGLSTLIMKDFVVPLAQFEPEDTFLVCDADHPCDQLFPDASQNLLFVKADRKAFLATDKVTSFDDLQARFYAFKNIFFIPFGIEFEKKVLEEMSPTVVLFLSKKSGKDANDADVETFQRVMGGYAKRCYASIINEAELGKKQLAILSQLKDELGMDSLPRVMVLEADMDTMKLQKYTYPFTDVKPGELQEFLGEWVSGKLQPTKRSQRVKAGQKLHGFPVINHDMFKTDVFRTGQESVVLAHKDLEADRKSHAFLDFLKRLSKESEFSGLKFFVVDGEQNDLPVFYSKLPSLMIFTKNSWENPLVYDKEDYGKLREVVQKRKELVIDLSGEDEPLPEDPETPGSPRDPQTGTDDFEHETEL